MKTLVAIAASALAASGIALASAAPANAGCQGGFTPWGGGQTCDGPLAADGSFQRCVTSNVLGFGGTNCYILNVSTMSEPVPYVGP